MNVQQVFGGPNSGFELQLSAMASGGLQLARLDARWARVEPNPPTGGTHTYDWSIYDGIVQALAEHGLRWLPIVDYSTTWSGVIPGNTASAVATAHIPDFAAYAAALARRYGRGGTFWQAHPSLPPVPVTEYEIWNEENNALFWQPSAGNAEQYADLYMAARNAIKAVDPQSRVYIGGLALVNTNVTDEVDFVRRMFAHRPDLSGHVDGVGLHPYQADLTATYIRLANFRHGIDQIMGTSVPIEITEVGWSAAGVSEAERASELSTLAQDLPRSDCNVDRLLPFTWLTEEQDPGDPEQWFGIWNHDGTAKPSGQAYLDAVRLMRGMTSTPAPAGTVPICSTDYQAAQQAQQAQQAPPPPPHVSPSGPRLTLRIRHRRHRPTLIVTGRCRTICKLDLSLMARRRSTHAHRTRVTSRRTGFSALPHRVRLRIPRKLMRRARRAQLLVVAVGLDGGTTTAHRTLRIR